MKTDTNPEAIEQRGLWLNTILLSVGFGLCSGAALLLVTFVSLAVTGDAAGRYLNLLGVFMPGYRVSAIGAWIGFFWAFVYSGISGGVLYQAYMRAAGAAQPTLQDAGHLAVARLSGWALGVALGTLLAAQLLLSTAWLIMRGTADESIHAALLVYYLPGYSVTWAGAAVGAFWLFSYTVALSMLFAYIYNTIAGFRFEGGRPNA